MLGTLSPLLAYNTTAKVGQYPFTDKDIELHRCRSISHIFSQINTVVPGLSRIRTESPFGYSELGSLVRILEYRHSDVTWRMEE